MISQLLPGLPPENTYQVLFVSIWTLPGWHPPSTRLSTAIVPPRRSRVKTTDSLQSQPQVRTERRQEERSCKHSQQPC